MWKIYFYYSKPEKNIIKKNHNVKTTHIHTQNYGNQWKNQKYI